MGYYTSHNLEIKENRSSRTYDEIFKATVAKFSELQVIDYALSVNLECCESVKWYEHQKHMMELTESITDVLYVLTGEGEDNGDMWKEYWLNGKCHRADAKIVYEEFDEAKLVNM